MLTGDMLIGRTSVQGTQTAVNGIDPRDGSALEPRFGGAGQAEVDRACALAAQAARPFRALPLATRAQFLETVAANILELGDELVERACAETGLPRPRIEGERGRTVGQLRLFAEVVRSGDWIEARIDPALPDRKPLPRPDLRLRHIALGPVAVFGASNFPLAFSTAGGDTASAFAAGCPVIVKAHPAHPGTAELVGRAIQSAVAALDLPEGVFSLLFSADNAIARALVTDPRIKAVGFTGSRAGGLALVEAASGRREPIPVYAEMSSINPTILLPAALQARAPDIARGFVASLTLGAGQFCTNPGLVLAIDGPDLARFLDGARAGLEQAADSTMLTPGIHKAYDAGVSRLGAHEAVNTLARGQAGSGPNQGQAALFVTDAESLLAHPELQDEVFGAAGLVVRCADAATLTRVLTHLEGQLTATLHLDAGDHGLAAELLPLLEEKAGRILVNGFPTGVEVCHAMVHGGPFPATSDSRTTSVGTLAIRRFLRPICYQDLPAALLPQALQDDNPDRIWRKIDGQMER